MRRKKFTHEFKRECVNLVLQHKYPVIQVNIGLSTSVIKRLLNNRNTTDPTERYAELDQERVFEALQRIELHMFMTAPKLYNMLLASAKYPPLNETC